MDGSGCMKENSKMQKREFLKGSLAALGVFGCGAAAARSEFPEARDIKWDETFDVVVVGSGIAATCAANESIDLGAKRVIMVDKMPVFGGNSAITGFWINVPRTPEQLAHGVKDDSPELFLKDTLKAGEYFNDPKLAHALSSPLNTSASSAVNLRLRPSSRGVTPRSVRSPRRFRPAFP